MQPLCFGMPMVYLRVWIQAWAWLLWLAVFSANGLFAQVVEIQTSPLSQPGLGNVRVAEDDQIGEPAALNSADASPEVSPFVLPSMDAGNFSGQPAFLANTLNQRSSLGAVRGSLSSAPNMIGDTSAGSCGVLRFNGAFPVASVSHPTFACSRINISENNSALVRDRIYTTYRHFEGASDISVFPTSPNGGTASLDIDRFTFGVEKAFNEWSSLELRIPINVQMSSDLSFSQTTAPVSGGPPDVSLPLDDYETSLGNLALIMKVALWSSDKRVISAGLGANFPTSPNVRLRGSIDDENFVIEDENGSFVTRANVNFSFDATINNELFTLSPFAAFLLTPNQNWFMQGFAQLDFPVRPLFGSIEGQLRSPLTLPEFSDRGDIQIQQLARFGLGIGRTVYRSDYARYLNQIAVTGELHYTTTIEDASISKVEILPSAGIVPETTVEIGNVSNRSDVLNFVLGNHVQIAKTTMTTGFSIPLRGGDDKGFDYEIALILNRQF